MATGYSRRDKQVNAPYDGSMTPPTDMMPKNFSDIRRSGWIERVLPPSARPYARLARLDRPIGWWLLLLPCWWGTALAARGFPDIRLLALFWLGAVVMRGAGCTLNDIIDRDIDAKVERTRSRPIPAGEVSVVQAGAFMLVQLALGAVVLFSLRPQVLVFGFAVLVLVATYPFMKRVTFWPQLFLGLNFNWGVLIAWVAVTGHLAMPAVLLYLAGVAWTLGYDTIYAHQDKADDARIGVKSTALRFGARSKLWVGGFYLLAVIGVGLALRSAEASWIAAFPVVLTAGHFIWQLRRWRMDDPASCLAVFKSNRTAGLLIFLACVAVRWV